MRVYCDSAILIYFFEGVESYRYRASAKLAAMDIAGDSLVLSSLVRLECLVLPTRVGDAVRLAGYSALFANERVEFAPIAPTVFEKATEIRAFYNFKLADSLHLATAVLSGCDSFLTSDLRLAKYREIPVQVLP